MTPRDTDITARLAGRDRELRQLAEALERMRAGHGGAVFICGEAGIGKSALAAAAVELAGDMPAVWGYCWESGGAPAYWPWTQVLESLVDQFRPDTTRLPALGQVLPDHAPADPSTLQPDQARFRLFEAVRRLLSAVSDATPLILVLEDLHAADSDSLQLLKHMVRHLKALPVLLIGTFRDTDARESTDTDGLWHSARDAAVLPLSRLTEDETLELVTRTRGDDRRELAARLFAASGGNPLFLTELLHVVPQDLAEIDGGRLPRTIRQLIDQQLAKLPPETIEILRHASVLGRRYSAAALGQQAGIEPEAAIRKLAPAEQRDIVARVSADEWQFSHTLVRDACYQGIDADRRRLLHERRAEALRARIAAGESERWTELASHLTAAGHEHQAAAVTAWRNAAAHARQRLAFRESLRLYEQAHRLFGSSPSFAPDERVRLMLEVAGARLALGDVGGGRSLCVEAFGIARTLEDPALMAQAALTLGSVIVVAKVDRQLVAMLQEALQAQPHTDSANRARVMARLAAAQQPAADPGMPMQMAWEAIDLARSTRDEDVIYDVLRSAISALMDFAAVDERMPLNREVEALARRRRDLPGEFRSNLRLMIDAGEAGDRQAMDEAINACERIASQVQLPHYAWRVASARAMQAVIDGRYEAALALLDEAESLAAAARDESARITVSLQRLALHYEWAGADTSALEQVKLDVQDALKLFPDAEVYASPLLYDFAYRSGEAGAGTGAVTAPVIERLFAGGDRFCLAMLGEIAVRDGNIDMATRALEALRPHQAYCCSMGLMGTHWGGPVALAMARICLELDRYDEAARLFDQALAIAVGMGARALTARIHADQAALADRRGDADAAARLRERSAAVAEVLGLRPEPAQHGVAAEQPGTGASPPGAAFAMRRDGDVWQVVFQQGSALIRDTRGMQMLARLVAEPDRELHVLDLGGGGIAAVGGDAGPMLDNEAREQYRSRVAELTEELADAESLADIGRAEALREELEFLTRELSRAFGIGGRRRRSGADAERARVNVRRRIIDAIRRIDEQLPGAGRYLESTVKTGTYCRYTPV